MMIRDIKIGDTLYVFNRGEVSLNLEKVVSVSAPHLDKGSQTMGMVVEVNTETTSFTLKDTSEIGYAGNFVVTADRSLLLREVETQKANNEAQIARVDTLKAELPKFDSVIDMLNPDLKAKKAQEERLDRLEGTIGSLKEMVEQLVKSRKNG